MSTPEAGSPSSGAAIPAAAGAIPGAAGSSSGGAAGSSSGGSSGGGAAGSSSGGAALRTFEVAFASGARTRCVIGPGALAALPRLCAEVGLSGTAGFFCDARLVSLHAAAVKQLGLAFGATLARPVAESRKTLAEVEAICETLSARGVARDGYLVALGGGVLTDLAGLAAALYQRGIPWACAPSTLLAQVDAGLGGKTGANLRAGKNLVGAFHQPRLLVCDPLLLATLPVRERWSGLAEIVKCALLEPRRDSDGLWLLERCERDLELAAQGDAAALAPLIEASLRIKADTVAADEREGEAGPAAPQSGAASPQPGAASPQPGLAAPPPVRQRAFLNLGHTIGHALESATHYQRFTHGEAVALGLKAMLHLSRQLGLLAPEAGARGLALVSRLRLAAEATLEPAEREAALQAVARDKKARQGQVRFVLLRDLGAPLLVPVDAAACRLALDAALA